MTALVLGLPGQLCAQLLPSAARPPPPHQTIISNPNWVKLPTGDDFAQFYPERASRRGLSGHVTIECTINVDGTLTHCDVQSETPPDQGFGDAAILLSTLFQMKPLTRDGVPVAGARVIIPIGFKMPDDGPPDTNAPG